MVEDLSPIDRWLIGILAHAKTEFRQALQRYLDSYRTVFGRRTIGDALSAFEVDSIVSEVEQASTRDRIEFLKIISKWGTREMMEPFLATYLDVNERSSNEHLPWLRLSYLSKAVKGGNSGTFQILLEAGACPTRALIYLSRHPKNLSPCESPKKTKQMIRVLAENAEPQHLDGHDEELLSLLLRTDDIRRYSARHADALIDKFFLQRAMIFSRERPRLLNTYILIAVVLDLPQMLRHLHESGFLINGNQIIGEVLRGERVSIKGDLVGKYTWLTLAVDLGHASCVKFFLANGANIMQPDPSGRIPVNMANDFVAGEHPRAAAKVYIWPYQPPHRYPSAEDDDTVAAALQSASTIPAEYNQMVIDSPGPIPASGPYMSSAYTWQYLQHMMDPLLDFLKDSLVITFRPLDGIVKAIKHNYHPATLWDTARKLSHLTFTEALFLRIIYLVSLFALLVYKLIDCL